MLGYTLQGDVLAHVTAGMETIRIIPIRRRRKKKNEIEGKGGVRETRFRLGSCVVDCASAATPTPLQVDVELRRDGESAQHLTRRSEAREGTLAVTAHAQVVVEVHVHQGHAQPRELRQDALQLLVGV